MGVLSYISEQKAKFRAMQSSRSELANIKKAETLKDLKEKRIRLEGKANLNRLEQKERERIAKAQKTIKGNSPGNRALNFAKNLQKTMKERQNQGSGINFGGSGFNPGGTQRDIFGGGSGDPFGMKPKEEKKDKPKSIIIRL